MCIESSSAQETSIVFQNFKVACHSGRGGIMFAVARGRLSEGIDFSNHLSRTVVMIGTPYLQARPIEIERRLNYLMEKKKIGIDEFLLYDMMKTANQCVGRCMRGKKDYSVIIYADKRFKYTDQKIKNCVPKWIESAIQSTHIDLPADQCISIAKDFLMKMSYSSSSEFLNQKMIGKQLLSNEDIKKIYFN